MDLDPTIQIDKATVANFLDDSFDLIRIDLIGQFT